MRLLSCLLLAGALACAAPLQAADAAPNTLTADEAKAGWTLLFDGTSLEHWRGYKKTEVPGGWKVEDGTLARPQGGGDLVTRDEYQDFDLKLEWKISPGGNSGVMFHVAETHNAPYETGPEMQILDNAKHPDGHNPKTSAGAAYALIACSKEVVHPQGEWNEAELIVSGDHVEHWLNGTKVVEYELHSPEWQALVDASKFRAMPDYAKPTTGRICLQDHGNPVWFRNVKIRVPDKK